MDVSLAILLIVAYRCAFMSLSRATRLWWTEQLAQCVAFAVEAEVEFADTCPAGQDRVHLDVGRCPLQACLGSQETPSRLRRVRPYSNRRAAYRWRRSITERVSKRVQMRVTGVPETRSTSSMKRMVSGWSWS